MAYGIIQGFSDIWEGVEWKVPNTTFDKCNFRYFDSPRFSLASCIWHLRVYPERIKQAPEWITSVFLRKSDPDIEDKKVTFSIGIKIDQGFVKERVKTDRFKSDNISSGWVDFLNKRESDDDEPKPKLTLSEAVTFTCRIRCEMPTPGKVSPGSDKVDSQTSSTFVELEGLSSDFKNFLTGEKTCDFTINVAGKEFRVHRSVLSARSPVFLAMFEHDTEEAKTGVLNIPDCNPESFPEFLSFIYTGKVENVSFETAYHLYSTADKYDVPRLKTFCAKCMMQNLSTDNVCDVVILADRHGDDQLMSSVQGFFNESFLKIFQKPKWSAMLKDIPRLADKLLRELAPAGLKTS